MNQKYTVKEPGHPLDGKTLWTGRYCGVCAIILLIKGPGEYYILANQRGKGCENFVMKWNLPCGFMEDDESGEQCARRETLEECGIDIPVNFFSLYNVETEPEKCFDGHVTIRYQCVLTKGLIDTDLNAHPIGTTGGEENEVNSRKWIPISEYKNYDWAFHHDEVIAEVISHL